MTYYIGQTPDQVLGDTPRYFYGLRRSDNGDLYLGKVDQILSQDAIEINTLGDQSQNFEEFEVGIDFFEGRDVEHNKILENLNYEQYRWDDRNMYYYIDDDGQLVVRVGANYTYPSGI